MSQKLHLNSIDKPVKSYGYEPLEFTKNLEVTKELMETLKSFDFLVTNYSTMIETKNIEFKDGLRGVQIIYPGNLTYDWLYNIIGGYKFESYNNS